MSDRYLERSSTRRVGATLASTARPAPAGRAAPLRSPGEPLVDGPVLRRRTPRRTRSPTPRRRCLRLAGATRGRPAAPTHAGRRWRRGAASSTPPRIDEPARPARRSRVLPPPTLRALRPSAGWSCSAGAARASRHRPGGAPPGRRSTASCARWPRSCAPGLDRATCCCVADGAEAAARSRPLRFFLSGRSAYVDGQVLRGRRVGPRSPPGTTGSSRWPARSRVVTGAARGHRRRDRRRRSPATAPRRSRVDLPAAGRGAGRGRQPDRRHGAAARRHRRRRAGSGSPTTPRPPRRARHPRPQRRASPATSCCQHGARAVGLGHRVNLGAAADQRARCSAATSSTTAAADRLRLVDHRASPATAGRPTTRRPRPGVIGHGPRARAAARRARRRRSTPSRPASSRPR